MLVSIFVTSLSVHLILNVQNGNCTDLPFSFHSNYFPCLNEPYNIVIPKLSETYILGTVVNIYFKTVITSTCSSRIVLINFLHELKIYENMPRDVKIMKQILRKNKMYKYFMIKIMSVAILY